MKFIKLLLVFLCLTSCKSADVNPTTTILKHIITIGKDSSNNNK